MSNSDGPDANDGGRPARGLILGLDLLAAALLFGMAALTFIDVLGRDLFSAPIPGTFETVGLLLGVIALAVFPMVTLRHNHITVDLFDRFITGRARRFRDVAVMLGTAAMAAFMAERLWAAAVDEWANDYVTEYFGISRAPLLVLLAVFLAGTAIALVVVMWRRWRHPTPAERGTGTSPEDRIC